MIRNGDHRRRFSATFNRAPRALELVGDAAKQLANDILERDEPFDLPARRRDKRLVRPLLAQVCQQPVSRHPGRNVGDRSKKGRRRHRPPGNEGGDDVLGVEDANEFAGRPLSDGETAVRARCHDAQDLFERGGGIDDGQSFARDHQLSRRAQPEPQRAVQSHLLLGFEEPAVATLGDQQLDFLRRVDVPVACRRNADRAQDQDAAAVEERDERPEEPLRPLHRQHGRDRNARRVLQRERLRYQLTDDDGEAGQDEKDGDRRAWTLRSRRPSRRIARAAARRSAPAPPVRKRRGSGSTA